jgi:hypothetical protein
MIRLTGFDDCIIGTASSFGAEDALAYSEEKILKKLQDTSDMDPEEAREYFDFNIAGGFFGEGNPIFVTELQEYEIQEILDDKPPMPDVSDIIAASEEE